MSDEAPRIRCDRAMMTKKKSKKLYRKRYPKTRKMIGRLSSAPSASRAEAATPPPPLPLPLQLPAASSARSLSPFRSRLVLLPRMDVPLPSPPIPNALFEVNESAAPEVLRMLRLLRHELNKVHVLLGSITAKVDRLTGLLAHPMQRQDDDQWVEN